MAPERQHATAARDEKMKDRKEARMKKQQEREEARCWASLGVSTVMTGRFVRMGRPGAKI